MIMNMSQRFFYKNLIKFNHVLVGKKHVNFD